MKKAVKGGEILVVERELHDLHMGGFAARTKLPSCMSCHLAYVIRDCQGNKKTQKAPVICEGGWGQ